MYCHEHRGHKTWLKLMCDCDWSNSRVSTRIVYTTGLRFSAHFYEYFIIRVYNERLYSRFECRGSLVIVGEYNIKTCRNPRVFESGRNTYLQHRIALNFGATVTSLSLSLYLCLLENAKRRGRLYYIYIIVIILLQMI